MFGIQGPEEFTATPGDVSSRAFGLDGSSAMVRAEADQLDARLRAFVQRLSFVPGLEMSVSYRHGKLRQLLGDLPYVNDLNRPTGAIRRVVVAVGPDSYWLDAKADSIACGRTPISARPQDVGEVLTFSSWARALFREIASDNVANHDSLVALRQLVEHDRVD
jgi:hypothetical protein